MNECMAWRCDWCQGTLRSFNGVIACELCRKTVGKDGTSFNDGIIETRNLKGGKNES